MNKRIISILLSLVMMLSMVATAVPVFAAPEQEIAIIIGADKTEAHPGDTVNYTISIGAVNLLGGLDFWLKIPDGLTIVDSSVALPDGLETTLDSDGAIVYPMAKNGYRWSYSAQSTGYTGNSELVILTFACTVDDDCEKEAKDVTIEMDVVFDNDELNEIPYTVKNATVNITDKPVAVTGIEVDETMSLQTGESKVLTVIVNPEDATNKNVKFSITAGSEFITVDANGKVTGVKAGTATVKVTTVDGDYSDTCTVTVACSHESKTATNEKASDCKDQGWDAYSTCDACGQIFNAAGEEIDEIPFRPLSTQHTGGTATCTAQAVCTVCSQPYGNMLDHDFTKEEKKTEALKTAGDCGKEAVYIKSCSACGKVDTNENNTFLGEKDPNNHASYGTYLDQPSEPDHKNGVDGYTGDKRCNSCKVIREQGQPIPAGAHVPADVWSTDSTHHWKECTVIGCGIVIDGSKAEHKSEKAENKAACGKQAVCDVCGVGYGEIPQHEFTDEVIKEDALKSEGDCGKEAVYIKSCIVCGEVDTDSDNTFRGEKNPDNHADYGTYLDGVVEVDHKNGIDGYTGDEKCNECDALIEKGHSIPAGTHVPADVWSTDSTHHWKECTVIGCGIVIDGSKAEHKSEKAENKAACGKQAVCDVCGVGYGEIPQHEFTDEVIKEDALKSEGDCGKEAVYIKSCIVCGEVDTDSDNTFRGEKNPDNHADYGTYLDGVVEVDHKNGIDGYTGDEKCNECDALIEKGHSIPAGTHVPAEDWTTDEKDHWKECTVTGCGVVIDGSKAPHTSEKPENKAACGKQAVCDVCGVGYGETPEHKYGDEKPEVPAEIGQTGLKAHYQCSECEKYFVDVDHDTHIEKKEVAYEDLIIPALVDNELTVEIPFSVVVKKTGDLDPAKETFTFKMFDLGYENAVYTVDGLTVDTNGVNTYTGKLVIKVKESQFGNLSEGFKFAQVKGTSDGWTYDETVYYVAPQISDDGAFSFIIFPGDDAWGETTLEKVEFTNSYNKAKEPSKPDDGGDNPPTGDGGVMWILVALMLVGVLDIFSVFGKKRYNR